MYNFVEPQLHCLITANTQVAKDLLPIEASGSKLQMGEPKLFENNMIWDLGHDDKYLHPTLISGSGKWQDSCRLPRLEFTEVIAARKLLQGWKYCRRRRLPPPYGRKGFPAPMPKHFTWLTSLAGTVSLLHEKWCNSISTKACNVHITIYILKQMYRHLD